jgi:hypothetical protein
LKYIAERVRPQLLSLRQLPTTVTVSPGAGSGLKRLETKGFSAPGC